MTLELWISKVHSWWFIHDAPVTAQFFLLNATKLAQGELLTNDWKIFFKIKFTNKTAPNRQSTHKHKNIPNPQNAAFDLLLYEYANEIYLRIFYPVSDHLAELQNRGRQAKWRLWFGFGRPDPNWSEESNQSQGLQVSQPCVHLYFF